jgi:hypothetical protein
MNVQLKIPTNWNQLNDLQLKKIATYFHVDMQPVVYDYYIFRTLLNVRWWQFLKKWKLKKTLKTVSLPDLKIHYDWVYNSLNLTRFIPKITLRKNIKTTVVLYAPADRINNLTADEFAHAEDLFLGWYDKKDLEYLVYLTAVLYREKDAKGKRIAFDKSELEQRAAALTSMDTQIFYATFLSYAGCRNYLIEQFPTIFPKSDGPQTPPKSSGFGKLILELSGKKFGTYQQTKATNIYTFLSDLELELKKIPK